MVDSAGRQSAPPPTIESGFMSQRYLGQINVDGFADMRAPKIIFFGAVQSYKPIGRVEIILPQVVMLRCAGLNAYMFFETALPVWLYDDFVLDNAWGIIGSKFSFEKRTRWSYQKDPPITPLSLPLTGRGQKFCLR